MEHSGLPELSYAGISALDVFNVSSLANTETTAGHDSDRFAFLLQAYRNFALMGAASIENASTLHQEKGKWAH